MTVVIHSGDCLDVMRGMADGCVDAVVTDPPAGIGFMGRAWDRDKGGRDNWIAWMAEVAAEACRLCKPGSHALVWALPRTSHWTATAWENAGWEVRDRVAHIFGSGFPKSHNLPGGLGTSLKPAMEDWWLLRKPLIGTVAENVARYGTGALNIDATRVPTTDKLSGGAEKAATVCATNHEGWDRPWKHDDEARAAHADRVRANVAKAEALGRWPANVAHDGSDEVLEAFAAFGDRSSARATGNPNNPHRGVNHQATWYGQGDGRQTHDYRDTGTAARFFYCSKASRADRAGSKHPTVKPIALMRWLCRLIAPPGGTILDPFAGSGTTGVAAAREGFNAVLIEREAEYVEDIRRRLAADAPLLVGAA